MMWPWNSVKKAENYIANENNKVKKSGLRKIVLDMSLNIMSTAIPTVVLQLMILPSLSNHMDGDSYGLMVTILAVLNVIPSTMGNVLNNVRLLHQTPPQRDTSSGDFQILLIAAQAINLLLMLGVSIHYLGIADWIGITLLIGVAFLWLGREYYIVAFRLKLNYVSIMLNNLFLVAGYMIGWFLFTKSNRWQLIYLSGYGSSWMHILMSTSIIKEPIKKSPHLGESLKDSVFLLISNILARAMNYADKILLYPLLGGTMVSVYYAATVFSKVISLAITPINSVALSYLSKSKKSDSLFGLTYLIGAVICIVGYALTVMLSRPVLTFLYPLYAEMALQYVWITSGTIVVSILTSMITPFVLCYVDTKWQIGINGSTAAIYTLVSLGLLKLGGLTGFCIGGLIANIFKLVITTCIYFKQSRQAER